MIVIFHLLRLTAASGSCILSVYQFALLFSDISNVIIFLYFKVKSADMFNTVIYASLNELNGSLINCKELHYIIQVAPEAMSEFYSLFYECTRKAS